MKTITPTEILVYYDGVDVFVGHDLIGGHYIGMIVDRVDGIDHYLVAGVSPDGLRRFRSGTLDLRTLLLEAPENEWFLTQADGEPGQPLVLHPQSGSLLATDLLPDEGFLLDDVPVDELALQLAQERGKVVFEFSAEPPETAFGHRMRAMTLAGLLSLMQAIVKHAYRNALRDLSTVERSHIDTTDAHVMDVVVPAMEGSYRVVLESAKPPDMFGSGELVRALRRLDEVFVSAENPDEAQKILQTHRGHLAGAYIRLVRFLSEHQTGLRYGWADPTFSEVRYGGVSEVVAHQLAESLSGVTNLATETVALSGAFVRVNLETGDWGLMTDEGRKVGKIGVGGPSLDGLVTNRHYRFECIEDIETDVTGREKHTLFLQSIGTP